MRSSIWEIIKGSHMGQGRAIGPRHQQMIGQDAGCHGRGHRHGADPYTRIMAALCYHIYLSPKPVKGLARREDGGGGLNSKTRN